MEADLFINEELTIKGSEIEIATSRSSGPGGQHVQKTDSRVTIRWSVAHSKSLSEELRERLLAKLQFKLVGESEIVLHVNSERSQLRNREIARERLAAMVIHALHVPKLRRKSKVSKAQKARRRADKKRTSVVKKGRSMRAFDE